MQVVGEYQRAPPAFHGTQSAGPDGFVNRCAPGARNRACFGNGVDKGSTHFNLTINGMNPAEPARGSASAGGSKHSLASGKYGQKFVQFLVR